MIPTELLGLGILLLLLLLLGVLLPEPPSEDSLGRPLAGIRGAESFGFGGTFGFGGAILLQLLVLWLKRPGGELPSLCIGGWFLMVDEHGVERPEDGRERSLLTGILLDLLKTPPPPPSPHSLILLLLLPLLLTQEYSQHQLQPSSMMMVRSRNVRCCQRGVCPATDGASPLAPRRRPLLCSVKRSSLDDARETGLPARHRPHWAAPSLLPTARGWLGYFPSLGQ